MPPQSKIETHLIVSDKHSRALELLLNGSESLAVKTLMAEYRLNHTAAKTIIEYALHDLRAVVEGDPEEKYALLWARAEQVYEKASLAEDTKGMMDAIKLMQSMLPSRKQEGNKGALFQTNIQVNHNTKPEADAFSKLSDAELQKLIQDGMTTNGKATEVINAYNRRIDNQTEGDNRVVEAESKDIQGESDS